jgi:hypothetical protein
MWQQAPDGRVSHPFEPLILAATLALIPVLIIESDAESQGWQTFAATSSTELRDWTSFSTRPEAQRRQLNRSRGPQTEVPVLSGGFSR